jgi:outer membrane receptor protein involved in Fe transport
VAEALAAFGRQTGLQLIYVSTIAETQQSKGARAGLTASEALSQLLEGTGLAFEFLNARTVRIFPAPTVVPTAVAAAPQSARHPHADNALGLEEVIVTARKREEEQSKVPINMVVWSQEDLQTLGVKGMDEIAYMTPSVQLDVWGDLGGPATTTLTIRGVSNRNTSITGLYLDETPIPPVRGWSYFRSFPFAFDLDRVEVLRGPQLQLFGEGNQAGAVRYIFSQPSLSTFTTAAETEFAVPAYGDASYEAGAAIGGPMIPDVLGFRVSAWRRSDGGFVDRVDPFTGATVDHNANHLLSTSVRGALTFAPSDSVRITPSLIYTSYDLQDSAFFFTNLSDVSAGQLRNGMLLRQPADDTFYLGALKVTASIGTVDLSAVSSYFSRTAAVLIDLTNSFTWNSPLGPGMPADYSDAIGQQRDLRQTTFMQELRLASTDPSASLTWDAGMFYSTEHFRDAEHLTAAHGLPGVLPAPVDLQNAAVSDQIRLAAFGEISFRMTKRVTVNAALHSEHTQYDGVTELPPILRSASADSALLPKVTLSYQADESDLLYLTAAKGYGLGGLYWLFAECMEPQAVVPTDTLWSYEAGTKSRLLDGRVQLDTGIFHITWNNGAGYPVFPGNPCNTVYLGTPGAAASNGFDVRSEALLGERLKVSLALAYADARYTRTFTDNGAVTVREGEAVGVLPHVVSPWNVAASLAYTVPLANGATAELTAQDVFRSRNPGPFAYDNPASAYYAPGSVPDPSTNLLNLRVGLRWAHSDLALFVNNTLDARATIQSTNGGFPVFFATTLRPRTIGLSAGLRF